ncbi:MAG: site-2 protease family protein [Deltaproteobacteria bacterium]|nr:site-2 protease family protein [Deltaproteobacteria bacterium]
MGDNGNFSGYHPQAQRPKVLLPATLFIATVITTVISGALYQGADILADPWSLLKGVPFSLSLLLILGTHELGHFIASRRHGVTTTLPTFIPGPPFPPMIGTFGAVIRIKSPITTKSALVDIGAAGPLAGFVVAIFVTWWGLGHSAIIPKSMASGSLGLGSSLIFHALSYITIGPLPATHDVLLHPVAFAGWIGFFVTAMNLLPIGQLDGGHIIYSLLGARHRLFSMLMIGALAVLGAFTWPGWFVWAALIMIIGIWHPPVEDQNEPMDPKRRLIALSALAVFVLTFMPTPFYIV